MQKPGGWHESKQEEINSLNWCYCFVGNYHYGNDCMTKDLAHIDVQTRLLQQLKLEHNIIGLQINALTRSLELLKESK